MSGKHGLAWSEGPIYVVNLETSEVQKHSSKSLVKCVEMLNQCSQMFMSYFQISRHFLTTFMNNYQISRFWGVLENFCTKLHLSLGSIRPRRCDERRTFCFRIYFLGSLSEPEELQQKQHFTASLCWLSSGARPRRIMSDVGTRRLLSTTHLLF